MQTKIILLLQGIVINFALRAETTSLENKASSAETKTASSESKSTASIDGTALKDNASDVPLYDGVVTDIPGSIPDTDATKILVQRSKEGTLRPKYGFEDIFLVKSASTVLDIHKLGVAKPTEDLEFLQTAIGVVARSEKDPSGGQRIYAGTNLGTTQILIYDRLAPGANGKRERGNLLKVYKVTVTTDDLITTLQEMKALIGNVEGLEIRIVGSQIVIDGAVLVPKDMRRVLAVVGKYQAEKKPVINLAEISPLSLKLLAEKMEEEIAGGKDRPKDIKIKVVNNRFFLEGSVDKLAERQTAEEICKAYVGEKYTLESDKVQSPKFKDLPECVQLVKIRAGQLQEPDPIISVRVDFVTLDKNYLKSFNFRWSPGFDSTGNVSYSSDLGKFTTSFVGLVTNLFPTLNSASENGYARILKSATLLVRDGENAKTGDPSKGTIAETINIPITIPATANAPASVSMQKVETSITVMPRSVPGSDKVNMDIIAKQAEIKSLNQTSGAATTLDNLVTTSLVVSNGESAALGGLITERRNVNIERTPSSTGASALGPGAAQFNLFDIGRGHSFKDSKDQFIVFVTPEKIRSPSEGTEKLKRKFRLRK